MTSSPILLALAGGILPTLIWLSFWLKEDEDPEPRRLLAIAFLGGICAIPLALILSALWRALFLQTAGIQSIDNVINMLSGALETRSFIIGFAFFAGLAFLEEYAKYFFARFFIFWRHDFNEPADAMIYLISTGLGFAAVENVLYLIKPFGLGLYPGFEISALRFIGATPLHALSSALIGYFLARSFFKSQQSKEFSLFLGLGAATLLHTLFNLFILRAQGSHIEPALILLFTVGVYILFAFESIKHTITKYYAKG